MKIGLRHDCVISTMLMQPIDCKELAHIECAYCTDCKYEFHLMKTFPKK